MAWSCYNLYPKGKGTQTEKLNDCRLKIEKILQPRVGKYEWFTIIYTPDRVKIGIYERNENKIIKIIEEEMKTDYPEIKIEQGSEQYYKLMAIASEARTVIENKISSLTIGDTALLVHFILNPWLWDFEGNVHIRALCNIKNKVKSEKLKEIICLIDSRVPKKV